MKDKLKQGFFNYSIIFLGWLLTASFMAPVTRIPWYTVILFPIVHDLITRALNTLADALAVATMGKLEAARFTRGLKIAALQAEAKEIDMVVSDFNVRHPNNRHFESLLATLSTEQVDQIIQVLSQEQMHDFLNIVFGEQEKQKVANEN